MVASRIESAAATRRALLHQASLLLDSGGRDAVTLREVGAGAGVSRGAPYRHFPDKECLLTAVAAESWERLGHRFHEIREDTRLSPSDALRTALATVIALSRRQPYLYQLMFSAPTSDPTAVSRAAQAMCDEFILIVSAVCGDQHAAQYAGILLTGVHGAAGLESSGLLRTDKWDTDADQLTEALLGVVVGKGSA